MRKGRRSMAPAGWSRCCANARRASIGAWSASPRARTRSAIPSRSTPRQLERASDGTRHSGTHRLSAARRQSGARRGAGAGRTRGAYWDQGNRAFSAHHVSRCRIFPPVPARRMSFPVNCRARFNLRFSTEQTVDGLEADCRRDLAAPPRQLLRWNGSFPDTVPDGSRRTCRRLRLAPCKSNCKSRRNSSTGGGTSDGRFIAPMGAQVIELGVINETIHKVNECVRGRGHRSLTLDL